MDEEGIDVTFLRASGAALAVNALVQKLLADKPADPAPYLIDLLRSRRLGFTAADLASIVENVAQSDSPHVPLRLLLEVLFDVAPTGMETFPLSEGGGGDSASAAANSSSGGFCGHGELVRLMPCTAAALCKVLRRDEVRTRASSMLSASAQPAETAQRPGESDNKGNAIAANSRGKGGPMSTAEAPSSGLAQAFSATSWASLSFGSIGSPLNVSQQSTGAGVGGGPPDSPVGLGNSPSAAHYNLDPELGTACACEELLQSTIFAVALSRSNRESPTPVPAFVRATAQLALGRLKLEAVAQRNERLFRAFTAEEVEKLNDANANTAVPSVGAESAGSGHAGAAPMPPANCLNPSPVSPSAATLPAPAPFSLHVVAPLRCASEFVDGFALLDQRLRWALASSFPAAGIHYFLGEVASGAVPTMGRDGSDERRRFPGSVMRVVARAVHSLGLSQRVSLFSTDGSDRDGFVAALVAATSPSSEESRPRARQLVLVLDSLEPVIHAGGLGNALFPLLCGPPDALWNPVLPSPSAPIALPKHLVTDGGHGLGSPAASAVGTSAGAGPTVNGAAAAGGGGGKGGPTSKRHQQQQQQQAHTQATSSAATPSPSSSAAGAAGRLISTRAAIVTTDNDDAPPSGQGTAAACVVRAALHHRLVLPWVCKTPQHSHIPLFEQPFGGASLLELSAVVFDVAALPATAAPADQYPTLASLNDVSHFHPSLLAQLAVAATERSGVSLAICTAARFHALRPPTALSAPAAIADGVAQLAHTILAMCVASLGENVRAEADPQLQSEHLARAIVAAAAGDDGKPEALVHHLSALIASPTMQKLECDLGSDEEGKPDHHDKANGARWLSYAVSMEPIIAAVTPASFDFSPRETSSTS